MALDYFDDPMCRHSTSMIPEIGGALRSELWFKSRATIKRLGAVLAWAFPPRIFRKLTKTRIRAINSQLFYTALETYAH